MEYPTGLTKIRLAGFVLMIWAHMWPGRYFTAGLAKDDPLKDFDAAEIIWRFFKAHRRQPS